MAATTEALARMSPAEMERIMRVHNRALYRTARAILRDDAEAQDVVQEAYIKAFSAMGGFRGESSLSTWLTRIAANEALGRRRKKLREARVVVIDEQALEGSMDHAADPAAGPEEAAMAGEARALLERRIDALPDLYREVFMLRAVEELSVEEAGAILGLPEATVRTRFFRARAMLRGALEREIDTGMAGAFAFDGARCDGIVARVLAHFARG